MVSVHHMLDYTHKPMTSEKLGYLHRESLSSLLSYVIAKKMNVWRGKG